ADVCSADLFLAAVRGSDLGIDRNLFEQLYLVRPELIEIARSRYDWLQFLGRDRPPDDDPLTPGVGAPYLDIEHRRLVERHCDRCRSRQIELAALDEVEIVTPDRV